MNRKFKGERREVLFLVDNCSGHKISNFSNIKFKFLPKNTTSILQPLDAGIINSFKIKYKNQLNNYLTTEILINKENRKTTLKRVDLFVIFRWLNKAWEEISSFTISNCWGKCFKMNENVDNCSDLDVKSDVIKKIDWENEDNLYPMICEHKHIDEVVEMDINSD
ncbi:Tigger transposable element-derived protein 6 [Dictyocoela muelleri]|nr:Tigger transposable element-derived protein 6 [Dictyocoela muelleri]